MPTNRIVHISAILEEVKWVKPNSILDVGIGFGMMATLFRAVTDVRKSEASPDVYHNWTTIIDGIEIFEWYRNPAWNMYTKVYIGDALEVIDTLEKYDFIYCGDMIEHLTKDDGYKLIDKMLDHANGWVNIATPSPAGNQGESFGNIHEKHISDWTQAEFENYATIKGYTCEIVGNFYDFSGNMLCIRIKK
jgi:hypothetical protein